MLRRLQSSTRTETRFSFKRRSLTRLSEAVHDRQYGADCGWIGHTVAGPDFRKHIFRRMAQFFKARQAEETTTALDRMKEPENGVQPFAIHRVGFPRHDLSGQSVQCFLFFGNDFRGYPFHRSLIRKELI